MRGQKQMTSSARIGTGSDSWCTPEVVLERVRRVGYVALDPCSNADSLVWAGETYDEDSNGLDHDWIAGPEHLVYVNPPYSDIRTWLTRCRDQWRAGNSDCTIALIPARTDTRAWHEAAPDAVCFWRGRLTFVGAPAPAPFPSAVLCWARGEMLDRFCHAFSDAGMVLRIPQASS